MDLTIILQVEIAKGIFEGYSTGKVRLGG